MNLHWYFNHCRISHVCVCICVYMHLCAGTCMYVCVNVTYVNMQCFFQLVSSLFFLSGSLGEPKTWQLTYMSYPMAPRNLHVSTSQELALQSVLVRFYSQCDTTSVIWEERLSTEKLPRSHWFMAMSVWDCLDWWPLWVTLSIKSWVLTV